jgi:retron-type reverse transcriptase
MSEPSVQGKSHHIPKRLVWDAWLKVKKNGGAAGVDGVTIEQFEEGLKDNLYRLWNRMSSGSYFPGPVRAVEIPKKGGTRVLGIPNVVDRVAQTVAVLALEPAVEKVFHEDSYGYRPGRSPLDAVAVCRKRCWKKDWVVDLDVKAFFDTVSWDLVLKAVARHTDQKWVLLYVERWLKAPMRMPDGTLTERIQGTPQGGPISPLLANPFSALRLRSLDLSGVPGCPVRTFRRRCGDPLCDQTTSLGGAGGDRASVRRSRIEAAPGQDEDSVLQGQPAAPELSGGVVHVLWVCVSSPESLQQG